MNSLLCIRHFEIKLLLVCCVVSKQEILRQKKEEYDEAIKLYHEVLNHEEGSAVIYNNLGLCYFYKDKFVLV